MDLQKIICLSLCPYYKPSKDEDLACLGFSVISRLITVNTNISFEGIAEKPDKTIAQTLALDMCISCPFFENDCDFIAGNNDAVPCGGFILLANLINKGVFSIDEVIAASRFSRTRDITVDRSE